MSRQRNCTSASLTCCALLFALGLCLLTVCLLTACCAKTSTSGGNSNRNNSNANSAQSNSAAEPTPPPSGDSASREPSLVALSAGAYIVKRPSEWTDSVSAYALLDENPKTRWSTARGVTSPQTIVIALPEQTVLKRLEFDSASTSCGICGAQDITVEMSDAGENDGFQKIADVSLKDRVDNQGFAVSAEVPGRWVRLTVKNSHTSDPDTAIELDEFRGYGKQLTQTPLPDVSGTYNFYVTGDFHLKQQGASVTGCYESREGLIKGGFEGHVCKFTWYEKSGYENRELGSGVMVFTHDGKQAIGVWWNIWPGQEYSERIVIGPKESPEVGSCPHWAGGVEEQITKDLAEFGRARVYGINFDSDSDHIKDESKPTLDKIVSMLKAKPDWKLTIEGHTDSTSTPQHNQDLSERRAASVKAYVQSAGVDSSRLKTTGYGATKPVASNDNELGRAQNRRVELTKQ